VAASSNGVLPTSQKRRIIDQLWERQLRKGEKGTSIQNRRTCRGEGGDRNRMRDRGWETERKKIGPSIKRECTSGRMRNRAGGRKGYTRVNWGLVTLHSIDRNLQPL